MSIQREVKQNKETKQQYKHPIIDILFVNEPLTREEIGNKLNIQNDRTIRDTIAICSMHYPIIATSNRKGYRRAKDINNLTPEEIQKEIQEVEHQIAEHKSRIDCIKKKMKPLIAWLKIAEKKLQAESKEEDNN